MKAPCQDLKNENQQSLGSYFGGGSGKQDSQQPLWAERRRESGSSRPFSNPFIWIMPKASLLFSSHFPIYTFVRRVLFASQIPQQLKCRSINPLEYLGFVLSGVFCLLSFCLQCVSKNTLWCRRNRKQCWQKHSHSFSSQTQNWKKLNSVSAFKHNLLFNFSI